MKNNYTLEVTTKIEGGESHVSYRQLFRSCKKIVSRPFKLFRFVHLLGCNVGTCWANLSSLSICSSVVFPALSRPRNNSLPDFFHKPEINSDVFFFQLYNTWVVCVCVNKGICVCKYSLIAWQWTLVEDKHIHRERNYRNVFLLRNTCLSDKMSASIRIIHMVSFSLTRWARRMSCKKISATIEAIMFILIRKNVHNQNILKRDR